MSAVLKELHLLRRAAGRSGWGPGEHSNYPAMSAWHSLSPSLCFAHSPSSDFHSSFLSECIFHNQSSFLWLVVDLALSHSPSLSALSSCLLLTSFLSAGREECRRSYSNRQYNDNCFLVTVTWQGPSRVKHHALSLALSNSKAHQKTQEWMKKPPWTVMTKQHLRMHTVTHCTDMPKQKNLRGIVEGWNRVWN